MDKLISADSLWMTIIHAMDYCEDILEFIEKEPEAVVRCKDCKECEERHTANYLPFLYCKLHEHSVSYNAFCCWAERREDAEIH